MEPDASDYAAFNLDADYEGGQWIGGEFFHEGERKKRKLTKEDHLYGVFNEEDDDDGGRGRSRGRGLGSGGAAYSKSTFVGFVPGGRFEVGSTKDTAEEEDVYDDASSRPGLGSASHQEEQSEEEEVEEEEEEDEFAHVRLPTSFGGNRRGRRGDDSPRSSSDGEAGGEVAPPSAWGSNYGSRLLAKMGWTGGGIKTSTGEGIDRPIEVRLRGKEGLGFHGAEKTQQQIEMEMKRAGRQPADAAKKEKKAKKAAGAKKKKKEPAWKKKLMEGADLLDGGVKKEEEEDDMDVDGAAKRRRKGRGGKVYKTAEEMLAARQKAGEKQIILDMTQAQPRVLTDLKQAAAKGGPKEAGAAGMPAPELQHNVRFYVEMKEIELQNLDRRIRQEESTKDKLRRQEERLQKSIDARAEQMKRLKTIMEIVDRCQERIQAKDMPLETLEKVFDMFRNKYAREYEAYKLSSLAYSLVGPLVKGKMESWQPLKDPGLLVELVTTWRKILRHEPEREETRHDGDGVVHDELAEGILRRGGPRSGGGGGASDMYNRMIVDIVLPVIRRGVINEWDPRDVEAGLRLVRLWAPPVLTREAYENLMMHFIFPKIARAVDAWNPRQDTVPIHAWLQPWLPFMRKQMESLFPTVRQKLAAALVEWHPSDASAHAILVPWQGVFDAAGMDSLLGRSILPKLILCLRELVINPLQQSLDRFHWAMAWVDFIPPATFIPLLEMEFFPKWYAVLANWLGSAAPNFEEVSKWYSGWKQLFPATLQAHPRMQALFNHALEIMNYHVQRIMAGGFTNAPPPPLQPLAASLPPLVTPSTAKPTAAPAARPSSSSSAAASATPSSSSSSSSTTTGSKEPTMREVVSRWAEDNDILFMPQNRMHDGKQVYSFGKLAVYVDKDLVFAPPATGSPVDKWLPVSFDELLARGR